MVKLQKNVAPKKAEGGGKLQKPLKPKNKKDNVAEKGAKIIKEAVKPELVKNVEPQNGKLGKKNKVKATEAPVIPKKDKKAGKVQNAIPEPVVSKKDIKKVAPVVEAPSKKNKKVKAETKEVVPVVEALAKKNKGKAPATEVTPVIEVPSKKNQKGKAPATEVTPVIGVPSKKNQKGKAPASEVTPVIEVPSKKNKKSEATPAPKEPTKKNKKANAEAPVDKKSVDEAMDIIAEALSVETLPEAPLTKKGKKKANTEPLPEEPSKKKKPGKAGPTQPEAATEVPAHKKAKKANGVAPTNGKLVQNGKPKNEAPKENQKTGVKSKKFGKNPVKSVEEGSKQVFDAPPFDEQEFNRILTHDNIETIVEALTKLVKKETENKKEIFTDYRYLLDVTAHKIPNCPKRMVKLTLTHPIPQQNEDDIVLIVKDLQRGRKVDHDPTVQHYEDLLRRNNIQGVKVIPFNQLKNEYSGYENKRKLVNSYEHILCDGRIVGNVVGFLGALTQKTRSTVHSVRLMDHNNVAAAIKKGIRRTAYKQINKGNMTTIPLASHRHTPSQVADNILAVLKHLKESYPGGLPNIRSLNIKVGILGTSSLPLYMSMVQGPESNPYVVGQREQKMLKLKRDTKDVLNKFQFTNDGTLQRLTQEQIAKKRKIQEGKLGEAVSEEVQAKKVKKEKKKKNVEVEEPKPEPEEEPEEEKVEELVRLDSDDDSNDEDGPVELVKEGEEFDEHDDEEDDEDDDDDDDDEEDDSDDE